MLVCEMSIDEQCASQVEEHSSPADCAGDFDHLSDDANPAHEVDTHELHPVYEYPPVIEFRPPVMAGTRLPRRKPNETGWFALGLSIAVHAAAIAIGFLLLVRYAPPTWKFEKGDGAASSDFSAANSDAGAGNANLPAAPVVSANDLNLKLASKSQQSDESLLTSVPEPFVATPIPEKQEPPVEQALFGVGANNPLKDPPPMHAKPAAPAVAESPASAATASPAQAEPDAGTSIVAPSAPQFSEKPQSATNAPVQKIHVWTDIHPSGAGGSGAKAGSAKDYDNRGLPIPDYPAESYRRREEGLVVLEVEVRADGSVYGVTVLNDSGYPRLAAAAVEAVRTRGHFTPATYDGQPTIAKLPLAYRFVITTRR